jgi:hypothetical protein
VTEDPDGTMRVRSKGIGASATGSVGSAVYEDVVRRGTAGRRFTGDPDTEIRLLRHEH